MFSAYSQASGYNFSGIRKNINADKSLILMTEKHIFIELR